MKAPSTARRLLGTAARASGLLPDRPAADAESRPAIDLLFDEDHYGTAAGLEGRSRQELLEHYRLIGAAKDIDPHPLFSTEHYRSQLKTGESCPDPIRHYVDVGSVRGLDPHPFFATTWYLDHYADVAAAGLNPLAHYIDHGATEGRSPGPDFDGGWYLEEYRDVALAGMNPLIHYLLHGRLEGRFATPGAKRSMLVAINGEIVDIGAALPLDATDWRGPAVLLHPPVTPQVQLDIDALTDHKVISFDVWDTLIMRRCHPEEVKLASARHLLLGFHRWIRPPLRSINALYRLRLAAESKVSFGGDNEYRFTEATGAWIEHALEASASAEVVTRAVESLLANELATETRVTYRNPDMDSVLTTLAGRTLVFTSDFYLSAKSIQRLLIANDVRANFARSWSSCESGEAKRSGRLFNRMLDELEVDPTDVAHLGDNHSADVEAAGRAGLTAIHYRVDRLAELDTAVAARIAGECDAYEPFIGATLAAVEDEFGDDVDRMTTLGVRFAPVAVGLALKIVEQALTGEADRISFFTREGVFLKQLVDLVIAGDPYGLELPPTELVEVSRRATFAPSLDAIEPAELMRLWSMYSTQSPRGLIASLGLDEEPARSVFTDHDLDFDQPVHHPWENERFLAALADPRLREVAETVRTSQRGLLRRYLDEHDLLGRNPLVVDLGWRGTIQDNLGLAIGRPLSGAYLGLYQFLNDQPANSAKTGWLFDHNDPDFDSWTIDEVAPLEMLFNGAGGSVTGYQPDGDRVVAIRQIDPIEEAVIVGPVAAFQAGVLAAAAPLIDQVARHGLTSEDLRPLSRKLVRGLVSQPPVEIAEAFFALSHNETFGTGVFQTMDVAVDLDTEIGQLERNDLYSVVARAASDSRWPEGMGARARSALSSDAGSSNGRPRALHVPTRIFASAPDIVTDGTVGIFAPAPIIGSGGHRTIYNLAKAIAATGLDVRLFLDGTGNGIDDVVAQLQGSGVSIEIGWETTTGFDYALATVASSSEQVEAVSARFRGYLVQDFEASFNPVSDGYIAAESSYRDGFDYLTVGSWLGHVMQTRYGSPAFASGLGASHEIYRPLAVETTDVRPPAVCFLYQPEKPRRTPKLGIGALRLVKQACPDVEINIFGSEAELDLDFEVENHGLIRDLDELNELYNRCRVGLCLSMTNPSRIPFELMASGTVPVDVYRYNTLFDYDDGTAVLAYQAPASLAAAMIALLTDEKRWLEHQKDCLDFVARRPLAWETDVMVNTVLARISDIPIEPAISEPTFRGGPVIADSDAGRATMAFCDWQRRSAEL